MVWYKIFNTSDFDSGLTSKEYTVNLDGIGQKTILVTKGNLYSMVYDDVFLSVDLNGANPFTFDGYSILRADSGNVYLGVPE